MKCIRKLCFISYILPLIKCFTEGGWNRTPLFSFGKKNRFFGTIYFFFILVQVMLTAHQWCECTQIQCNLWWIFNNLPKYFHNYLHMLTAMSWSYKAQHAWLSFYDLSALVGTWSNSCQQSSSCCAQGNRSSNYMINLLIKKECKSFQDVIWILGANNRKSEKNITWTEITNRVFSTQSDNYKNLQTWGSQGLIKSFWERLQGGKPHAPAPRSPGAPTQPLGTWRAWQKPAYGPKWPLSRTGPPLPWNKDIV